MPDEVNLDEFDKDEWRCIVREIAPEWTEEEFNSAWTDFIDMKLKKKLQ